MLLFRITGKRIEPLAPGSAAVDHTTIFDLPGAAAKTGKSEKQLIDLYVKKWGPIIPEQKITGAPLENPTSDSPEIKQVALALTDEQRDELIRQMLYPQLPPEAWEAFKIVAAQRKLSIYCRHLHPQLRYDGASDTEKLVIITSIEAIRLLARRTGHCRGRAAIEWAGPDRVWVKEWNGEDEPPTWARCAVYRDGDREPTMAVVEWRSFAPYIDSAQGPVIDPFWLQNSALMLGKCAEVAAYRATFPEELEGIYTRDEMRQADNFQPKPPTGYCSPRPAAMEQTDDGDSQVNDFIEEEDFQNLLAQAFPDEKQRLMAISAYKVKYKLVLAKSYATFHNLVAADIQKMIDQREFNCRKAPILLRHQHQVP